jgi:hypothetical protein
MPPISPVAFMSRASQVWWPPSGSGMKRPSRQTPGTAPLLVVPTTVPSSPIPRGWSVVGPRSTSR